MPGCKSRFLPAAATILVAGGALLFATLPPRPLMLAPMADNTVVGVVHIHTARSDGRSTPDEIAAIAARAGLKFLVFTDHGDATRTPDPPTYRSGVLCLDGVEISTRGGHYVALDMAPAPYPLAGEPRDVVDDVKRLGGFGIISHPDSPKPELRWRDWAAPFDGVEWVNPDTSWRVYAAGAWTSRLRLIGALFQYPIRQAETVAILTTPPESTATRWNALATKRNVVIIAGVDAHAKLAFRDVGPGDNRGTLAVPTYDASLKTLSVRIEPDRPFTGDATIDGATVMRAVRAGHLHVAMDALAAPASFEFTATNLNGTAHEGDELRVGGPVTLHVRSNAPDGFTTILWRGRQMLATGLRREFTVESGPNPAVYRVEIRSTQATHEIAWLYSNPIYVRASAPAAAQALDPPSADQTPLFDGTTTSGWHVEEDTASRVSLSVAPAGIGRELQFAYSLSAGRMTGQRATLVWGTPDGRVPAGMASNRRIRFTARADRPMRISVQLRTPDVGRSLRRWLRSVYLDTTEREQTIAFDEFSPSPDTDTPTPPLDQINAVLFVVDTVNTKPGSSGRIWIRTAALQK